MKAVWIIIVFCLTTLACASQPEQRAPDSEKVALEGINKNAVIVDAQLVAYNKHDLESLLAFFHPDIESYNSTGERQVQGIEALRETFANQFNHKPTEAVVERIVEKNYVIDKVEVTFVVDGQAMTHHGVVIYTIEDGLIRKMTFL